MKNSEGRQLSEIMNGAGKSDSGETKPTLARANKGLVTSRVSTLYKLLVKGASRADLRQIAAKWDISDRQIERYIAMATEEVEKRANYRRNYEMGKAMSRLDEIYVDAENAGDIRGRLGVVKQVADIVGLNAAQKQEISMALIESAEWQTLRSRILKVMEKYPEARAALLAEFNED